MSATKLRELGEIRLCFSGEADDQRRAQRDTRHALADTGEQPVVGLAVARPAHALQDVGRGMLQRQVDVAADLLTLRHRLEHVVGDGRRIEIEQTNPVESVDRVQLAQQPGQRAAFAAIDAVKGRVLRDEQQSRTPRSASVRASRTIESWRGSDRCRAAWG